MPGMSLSHPEPPLSKEIDLTSTTACIRWDSPLNALSSRRAEVSILVSRLLLWDFDIVPETGSIISGIKPSAKLTQVEEVLVFGHVKAE